MSRIKENKSHKVRLLAHTYTHTRTHTYSNTDTHIKHSHYLKLLNAKHYVMSTVAMSLLFKSQTNDIAMQYIMKVGFT